MFKILAVAAAASVLLSSSTFAQQPQAPGDAPYMNGAPTAPQAGGAFRPRGRFAMMDTNHDGRVTLQEFIAFQDKLFDRIDAGHKGQLTKADIDAFIAQRQAEQAGRMTRGQGGRGGGQGGAQFVKLSDRLAGGGVITRQQWENIMSRRFQHLDVNHAGFLTPDAFQPMQRGMQGQGAGQ